MIYTQYGSRTRGSDFWRTSGCAKYIVETDGIKSFETQLWGAFLKHLRNAMFFISVPVIPDFYIYNPKICQEFFYDCSQTLPILARYKIRNIFTAFKKNCHFQLITL